MIGILLLDLKNKKKRKKKKTEEKKKKKCEKMGSCGLIGRDSEISVYLLVNNTTGVGWRRLYCRYVLFETFSIVYIFLHRFEYSNICLR